MIRRLPIVLAGVLSFVALWSAASPAQVAETPEAVFAEGNRQYEAGDYDAALDAWLSLVEKGAQDARLFFNVGNAYYKIGEIGHAVLYYERAQRLMPRDDDIAANLALARLMLRDRDFLQSEGWVRRTLLWVPRHLSTGELVFLTSVFYLLFVLIAMAVVFRDTVFVSRTYRVLSYVSPGRLLGVEKVTDFALAAAVAAVLMGVTGVAAWNKHNAETKRLDAVVVQEEVPVYGGPTAQATLQFKIHEGTLTRIADARPGWVEVELPGDLSGWVRADALERI